VRTALDAAIRQACGLSTDIRKTAQQHYIDVSGLLSEFGFVCSVENNIATKKDITKFLGIPESTLDGFLRKHKAEIIPIRLGKSAIRSLGSKASRMNGYCLGDVGKIALGMDSVVGIELKKRVFGQVASFAKPDTRDEIRWRKTLSEIFEGFDLRFNYPIGKYKADFFVAKLMLVLECNGYCHRYYDPAEEAKREKFISRRYGMVRFDHKVSLETLFNGILQAKPGTVVRLYDFGNVGRRVS
jgi:very-short-patch-repair endonuclease